MKKNEIVIGGHYIAKVSGKLVTVRIDAIRDVMSFGSNPRGPQSASRYDVTNLSTGRKTTFRSAAKFRQLVTAKEESCARDIVRKFAHPNELTMADISSL